MGAGRFLEIKTEADGTISKDEIVRVTNLLREGNDDDKCFNIIKDLLYLLVEEVAEKDSLEFINSSLKSGLLELVNEKQKNSKNDKLIDLISLLITGISVGMKSKSQKVLEEKKELLNEKMITDSIKEEEEEINKEDKKNISNINKKDLNKNSIIKENTSLIEKYEGSIREKRRGFVALKKGVLNGMKIEEIEEIVKKASEIEEEGMKKMVEEENEGEREEWRRTVEAALMLEVSVDMMEARKKRKRGEEIDKDNILTYMSYSNAKEGIKREKEEKEKILKENEEVKKENDKLKEEVEAVKIEQDPLLYIPVFFSDIFKIKREGSSIVHNGDDSWETCIIGGEMKNGIHRINFKNEGFFTCLFFKLGFYLLSVVVIIIKTDFGLIDSSLGIPESGRDISYSHKVWNKNHNWVGDADNRIKEGDIIGMEVDLRSEDKKYRTLHFFINNNQQEIFFSGLPESVQFGVSLDEKYSMVTFISYVDLIFPLARKLEKGREKDWEGQSKKE